MLIKDDGGAAKKFVTMDKHEAVKVGDLEKTQESRPVVKPKFTTDFPEAVVREGANELTPEEGITNETVDGGCRQLTRTGTLSVMPVFKESKDQSGQPCIVDTRTCMKQDEGKKSGENKKADVLWALKEATNRGVDFYDASHEKEIKTRAHVRLDVWAIHLKKSTTALAKTLEGLDQCESVPSVESEWSAGSFGSFCCCPWF